MVMIGYTCHPHLQGPRISQARYQHEAGGSAYHVLHVGFLLGLFFNPEDGGNIFLQTAVDFQWTTQRWYISEDRTLCNHCCENPKILHNELKACI
jgi:hypothetical protein